jgi:hypothetical protein
MEFYDEDKRIMELFFACRAIDLEYIRLFDRNVVFDF